VPMPFPFAPPRRLVYLALSCAACGGGMPGTVIPVGARPATLDEAREWFAGARTGGAVLYRFRWQYRDLAEAVGGRGSARITSDSLRFDVAGTLGSFRGAAVVVGDTSRWAEPEEEVARFVPSYPLLWAMLGVARMPAVTGEITRAEDDRMVAWRFVDGSDTVEYARLSGPPVRLIADVRRHDGRLGRVETVFGPSGIPRSARLVVPGPPARLDITYVSTESIPGFPADIWARPDQR
jgi:hypothetical protein